MPRASLVRLGQRLVDRDRVPLPPFAGKEIVLTVEGEEGFFLEPVLRFESDRRLGPAGETEVPLRVLATRSAPGRTVLEVERPPALVAARLRSRDHHPGVRPRGERARRRRGRQHAPPRRRTRGAGTAARRRDRRRAPRGRRRAGARRQAQSRDRGRRQPAARGPRRCSWRSASPHCCSRCRQRRRATAAGMLRFGGNRAYAPRYDIAALFRDAAAASAGCSPIRARCRSRASVPIAAEPAVRRDAGAGAADAPGPAGRGRRVALAALDHRAGVARGPGRGAARAR